VLSRIARLCRAQNALLLAALRFVEYPCNPCATTETIETHRFRFFAPIARLCSLTPSKIGQVRPNDAQVLQAALREVAFDVLRTISSLCGDRCSKTNQWSKPK
jgi:hypothetical protein